MEPDRLTPRGAVGTPSDDGHVDPIWSADDVVGLTRNAIDAAAVGAALELGLFWLLDRDALNENGVGRELGIPGLRAGHWLRLLASLGFLEETPSGFVPSERCRGAILATYSRETWALLAQEARESLEPLIDLPGRLLAVRSMDEPDPQPSYVDRMVADPERARRFTRMLFELHGPLANALAERLDLQDVRRLMDLGGGSGVVSMALLRRWPDLRVTVVDIENVSAAGREIAREAGLEARFAYHLADFQVDPLPTGFDAVLECDVGIYEAALFAKVRRSLDPGGRFLIVDEFAAPGGFADRGRLRGALLRSLADPGFVAQTADAIALLLQQAGFAPLTESRLLADSMTVTEAIAV